MHNPPVSALRICSQSLSENGSYVFSDSPLLRFTYLNIHICLFVFFSGVGQNDSEFIDISKEQKDVKEFLSELFIRAGFTRALTTSKDRLLPCPLGTFVNKSVTVPNDLKCLECPAGEFLLFVYVASNVEI